MKTTIKAIEMGPAGKVETMGCVVLIDGEEVDSWSAVTATARAGRQVWSLSPEQVASLKADVAASFTRVDHPMRGFHK